MYDESIKEQAILLYLKNGKTVRNVAATIGVSKTTIHSWLQKSLVEEVLIKMERNRSLAPYNGGKATKEKFRKIKNE